MKKTALIVFVKEPIAGKVKTRLVPPFSNEEAAQLYSCFIKHSYNSYHTLEKLADLYYFYTPEFGNDILKSIIPNQKKWIMQVGDNLGTRMYNAFRVILEKYKTALIIGSDHPNLPITYIKKAISVLNYVDVSIGPTNDGGYYCIGSKKANQMLFNDINWSTESVYKETLNRIKSERLELFVLPEWYDIDNYKDLKRFIADSNPVEYPLLYDYLYTIDFLNDSI